MSAGVDGVIEDVPGDVAGRALLERLASGDPQIDEILDGGFPSNSINIVMGQPGSGKTIFVEKLIFANAASDRPILYLTTLSEPLDKVVKYLQQFEFFDEQKLAEGWVVYEGMGDELASEGISALVPRIRNAIKSYSPKIIVIDSFKAIRDLAGSLPEMRAMLYELGGLLTAYETTVFLVGEYTEDQTGSYPEFAVADGIIELQRKQSGMRDERFLRVLKLRGSDYRQGFHAFRISTGGLEVFPRLVSPTIPHGYEMSDVKVSTGVDGVNRLLEGGLWRGSATLVAGPTGSGKTTVGLGFVMDGVRRGEQCLYVNFQENPSQLRKQIQRLGHDYAGATQSGLHFLYATSVELQIDSIIVELFRTIEREGIERVVIDSVGDLANAAGDVQRLQSYLYTLVQHFSVRGITSMLTLESGDPGLRLSVGGFEQLSQISDCIFWLGIDKDERRRRTFSIVKARGTAHDLGVHELAITRTGAVVS